MPPSNNRRPVLAPGTLKGFSSAVAPLTLPASAASAIYDARLDQGVPAVRPGSLSVNAAVNGSQTFRGCFECTQNGTECIYVATSDGSNHVSILRSTNGGTSFTNVTPSAGTWGDTRLTDVGPVYFALVRDGSTDYLVAQNGTDAPRVFDGTTMTTSQAFTTAPQGTLSVGFVATANLALATTVTRTDSTKFDGSLVTADLGSHWQLVVKTTWTTGETVRFINPGVATMFSTSGSIGQFDWLVDDGAGTGLWRNMKIEIRASDGTYYTMYDPTTDATISEDSSGTAQFVAANTLERSPNSANLGKDIEEFRFTWLGTQPTSNITINYYLFANGGYAPGGTNYGVAYSSGASKVSGPAYIIPTAPSPVVSGFPIPISSLIGYVYTVSVTTPASLPTGVTTLSYYRNDVGTTGYYRFATKTVTTSTTYTQVDGNIASFNSPVNYTLPIPAAGTTSLPIGTCMAVVNDRLFVGAGSRLWYSEAGSPFLFSQAVRFDGTDPVSTSGGSFTKAGETFNAIVAVGQVMTGSESLGSPQQGAVTTYVMTDRTTYVLSGFDAISLNKTIPVCEGTLAPFSPSQTNSGFFFLDSKYQIRFVEGTSSKALSKYVVDDQFRGIPNARLKYVWGVVIDERYYLAYTPSGGSANTRVMVYNQSLGFESIDRPIQNAQGLLPYYDSTLSRTRLYAFSNTTLFEHAAYGQTTDIGSVRPTMTITFGETSFGVPSVNVGNGFFLSDVDASGTATMSILCSTGNRAGTTTYTSVSLAAQGTDTKAGMMFAPGQGAATLTFQPTLSIQALGGTRLYRYEVETEQGPDSFRR